MALPFPIASTQTDAKSPIDQQLMDAIRLNQEYLDLQVGAGGSGGGALQFKVNGALYAIAPLLDLGAGKKIDGASITTATTFTRARLYNKKGGTSGKHEVDVLRNIVVNHPITSIVPQYEQTTQSIGRLGTSINTQSVTVATPTVSTQQIALAKAAVNIRSIAPIQTEQGSRWLVTFDGNVQLDSDYIKEDTIILTGTTDPLNSGRFPIEQINFDGLPSVVIDNGSGVAQNGVGGTGQLALFEYTFLATANDNFANDEDVILSGHTDGANNGTFKIYKTNQAGNNIWVKNPNGIEQGGIAGAAQCTRWVYSFSTAPNDTQYIVGEEALMSGHANGGNNGNKVIRRVNEGGNNLYVTNLTGVSQAGAGGTVDTLRFLYSMPTDPTGDISVGDHVELVGHSDTNNDGTFEVMEVNRFLVNNIEIYNPSGVVQGGTAGTTRTVKKIISFEDDYESFYLINKSKVLLEGVSSDQDNIVDEFLVTEINRGIGQFNIVVNAEGLSTQAGVAGRVAVEARSIFIQKPFIAVEQENKVRNFQVDDSATFELGAVPAESILTMDVLSIQDGLPEGLSLDLS